MGSLFPLTRHSPIPIRLSLTTFTWYSYNAVVKSVQCQIQWQTIKQCMSFTGHEWYHSPMLSPRGQGKLSCDSLLAVNIVTLCSDKTCDMLFSLLPPPRLRSSLPSLTTLTDCLQWSAPASFCIWLLVSHSCVLSVAPYEASCNVHRLPIRCSPTLCDLHSQNASIPSYRCFADMPGKSCPGSSMTLCCSRVDTTACCMLYHSSLSCNGSQALQLLHLAQVLAVDWSGHLPTSQAQPSLPPVLMPCSAAACH